MTRNERRPIPGLVDGGLRPHRVAAVRWLVAGLAALLACWAVASYATHRASTFEDRSEMVPGVVTLEVRGRMNDWLTVEYRRDGQVQSGRVWLSAFSPHYARG